MDIQGSSCTHQGCTRKEFFYPSGMDISNKSHELKARLTSRDTSNEIENRPDGDEKNLVYNLFLDICAHIFYSSLDCMVSE